MTTTKRAEDRLAAALHNSREDHIPFEQYSYKRAVIEEARQILATDPSLAEALGLGLAWQEAVEALPEGWTLSVEYAGEWDHGNIHGPTPAEALRALTARIREEAEHGK